MFEELGFLISLKKVFANLQGKLFTAHFATIQRKGAQSLFPSSYTLEKAVNSNDP